MLCGGTQDCELTQEIIAAANAVKGDAENQSNMKFQMFVPVKAMSQVVAGLNYFVKVQVAPEEYIHIRIYDHFGDISLTSIKTGMQVADPLTYF